MLDSCDIAPGSGGAPLGSYPLTTAMTWHNGLHLRAANKDKHFGAVHAIAAGEVVFCSPPTPPVHDSQHPQNYNPYGDEPAWTDNGIVIIRHATEIGASTTGTNKVTFFSAYMHLAFIDEAITTGSLIRRKEVIGTAGAILGRRGQIHFEICMGEADLRRLLGPSRPLGWTDPGKIPLADGRTDSIYGSLYVYLPPGTPTSRSRPKGNLRDPNPSIHGSAADDHWAPNTLHQAQWVEIRYDRGDAWTSSFRATEGLNGEGVGDPIGKPRRDAGFEYALYAEANRRHQSLSDKAESSPSGWYELLRFGRNIGYGSVVDALPTNAAHWREIPSATGTFWADLNAEHTRKFSDADFLAFKGWQCFNDDETSNDQRCDSAQIKRMIRDPEQPQSVLDRVALAQRLSKPEVRYKLKRAICKFPTEWDRETITQRYGWLRTDNDFKIEYEDDWRKFKSHAEAISFVGLPADYKAATWHFHPREIIENLRQCGWLSPSELYEIYSDSPYAAVNKSSTDYKDFYRLPLNMVLRKYRLTTPFRMSHFFGQVAQESFYMMLTREASVGVAAAIRTNHISIQPETTGFLTATSENREAIHYLLRYEGMAVLGNTDAGDGIKFRGRGFKQLTGHFNYSEYWVYRGWLNSSDYDHQWFRTHAPSPDVPNPQIVGDDPFNAVDTAGYFCAAHMTSKAADHGISESASALVTKAVNPNERPPAATRWRETKNSYEVFGDE